MILIDSHCHLNMLAEKADLEMVIKRAMDNNVAYMQTICTNLEELPEILQIAEKYHNVFASVGVHPNDVKEAVTSEIIISLTQHPKIISIGETGLDYYRATDNKNEQSISFENHIHAASKTNLPIIVHTREAEQQTIDILTSKMKEALFPGLIHCFTASENLARKMLDIGLYISIAGIVTFKNTQNIQDVIRFIPLERLLIETDSPYLAPVPHRGKANQPAFVKYVAEKIADIKGISLEEVAKVTTQNFITLFSKAAITI